MLRAHLQIYIIKFLLLFNSYRIAVRQYLYPYKATLVGDCIHLYWLANYDITQYRRGLSQFWQGLSASPKSSLVNTKDSFSRRRSWSAEWCNQRYMTYSRTVFHPRLQPSRCCTLSTLLSGRANCLLFNVQVWQWRGRSLCYLDCNHGTNFEHIADFPTGSYNPRSCTQTSRWIDRRTS